MTSDETELLTFCRKEYLKAHLSNHLILQQKNMNTPEDSGLKSPKFGGQSVSNTGIGLIFILPPASDLSLASKYH